MEILEKSASRLTTCQNIVWCTKEEVEQIMIIYVMCCLPAQLDSLFEYEAQLRVPYQKKETDMKAAVRFFFLKGLQIHSLTHSLSPLCAVWCLRRQQGSAI